METPTTHVTLKFLPHHGAGITRARIYPLRRLGWVKFGQICWVTASWLNDQNWLPWCSPKSFTSSFQAPDLAFAALLLQHWVQVSTGVRSSGGAAWALVAAWRRRASWQNSVGPSSLWLGAMDVSTPGRCQQLMGLGRRGIGTSFRQDCNLLRVDWVLFGSNVMITNTQQRAKFVVIWCLIDG